MKINMEQSFWFDGIAFDKNDYPVCEFEYSNTVALQSNLFEDYNMFDYTYGMNRYISLSELLKANSEIKWSVVKRRAADCDSITILNDLSIENEEMDFIVEFYLRVFYSALKNVNPNCYLCVTD